MAILSTPVWALEPKQCLSLTDMKAALAAEGQQILIIGDRIAFTNDTTDSSGVKVSNLMNAVTSDVKFSVGYQLEGDLPRVENSTKICVRAKLTNIRLYDARRYEAKRKFDFGAPFQNDLKIREAKGTRPVIVADTLHLNNDGTEQTGLPMVMYLNAQGRSASIYAVNPDEVPILLVFMGETDLTKVALKWLDETGGAH